MGSLPGSIPTFQDLHLTSTLLWLAAQKARTSSSGHHKGLERYTVWRMANAYMYMYLLHTACYQGWWTSLILYDGVGIAVGVWWSKQCMSLQRLILIINFCNLRLDGDSNGKPTIMWSRSVARKPTLDNSIERDTVVQCWLWATDHHRIAFSLSFESPSMCKLQKLVLGIITLHGQDT